MTCDDFNECDNDPCHETAACQNTLGSYSCGCPAGYEAQPGTSGNDLDDIVVVKAETTLRFEDHLRYDHVTNHDETTATYTKKTNLHIRTYEPRDPKSI